MNSALVLCYVPSTYILLRHFFKYNASIGHIKFTDMHCAIIVVTTLLQEKTQMCQKAHFLLMFSVLPFETTGATINVVQALNLEVPETVKALMTKEEEIKQANVE